MQTLIFLILAIGFYFFMKRVFTVGGSPRERLLLIAVGVGILGLLAYMVIHGRFQFLAPLMAGLIPLIRRLPLLLSLLGRVFPQQKAQVLERLKGLFGRRIDSGDNRSGEHRGSGQNAGRRRGTQAERRAALETLGLSGDPDKATIVAAHRRLMQAAHPDHGGSHEEAAKLNAAKDFLLAGFSKQQQA
ncbi:hypothetical protein [Allohahella marinimesophila]|uniref:J domain-containing protein n=1 Tax=Allohahella marinimesophila TaxID=1054972 RepID=A0ABP7PIY9_9GAMM